MNDDIPPDTDTLPRNVFNLRAPFVDPKFIETTAKVVNELFNTLLGLFPAWQVMGGDTAGLKKIWVDAFITHKINSGEQIKNGLEQCMLSKSAFFPSVGQFIEWCHDPKSLGLPSIDDAYKEATRLAHAGSDKNWSCPEIREAVKRIGNFNFTHMNAKDSRKQFEDNYRYVIGEKLKGKKYEPVLAIDAKKSSKTQPKERKYSTWEKDGSKSTYPNGPYDTWTPAQLRASITKEQRDNWKVGDVFPQFAHLTNAEKALPVLYACSEKWDAKQKEYKKNIAKEV